MTSYEYDGLGRQVKVTEPDPDGEGDELAPWTVMEYDANGNLLSTTDRLGHGTTYLYDGWGRLQSTTNANDEVTSYTYTDTGAMETLTDAESNTTTWTYDELDRVVAETNQLADTRETVYDGGLVWRKIDRAGRVVEYDYDRFGRVAHEYWYADETAADNDPGHACQWTRTFTRLVNPKCYERLV